MLCADRGAVLGYIGSLRQANGRIHYSLCMLCFVFCIRTKYVPLVNEVHSVLHRLDKSSCKQHWDCQDCRAGSPRGSLMLKTRFAPRMRTSLTRRQCKSLGSSVVSVAMAQPALR